MQTGLGSPKHTDAALWSSWFVSLYSMVGMTLANTVEFPSALTHASWTGLLDGKFLICKSRLVAATFVTFLHIAFWTRGSGVPSAELPAFSAGQLSRVSTRVGSF